MIIDSPAASDLPLTPDAGTLDVPSGTDVFVTADVPAPDDAPALDDVPAFGDTPTADDGVPDVPAVTDVPVTVDAPAVDAGSCALPLGRTIALPTDSVMVTLAGPSRVPGTSCATTGGPEALFPLHLAAPTGLLISSVTALDTVLAIRRVCDAQDSEFACDDDTPEGTAAAIRRVVPAGDYYVLLDQYGTGTGGAVTLNIASYVPAVNAACGSATTLTALPVTADLAAGGDPGTTCLNEAWGGQLFYTLRVPAGERATVTATPASGSMGRATVRILNTCAATTCSAGGSSPGDGMPATAAYDNRTAADQSVVVSVASTSARTAGVVSLAAVLSPVAPLAPAAVCATAPAVTGTIMAQDASLGVDRLEVACLPEAHGGVLYHHVTVPAHDSLLATVTPRTGWDAAVRLLPDCAGTRCLGSVNAAGAGGAEVLRFANTTAAAQDVVLAVGSTDPVRSGVYDLAVTLVPPATNTTCATATPVSDGTHLAAQDAASGTENATGACLPAATGTVLYYRATVPGGQTLRVRATPLGSTVQPVVRVEPACGATSCLSTAAAAGPGQPALLQWLNPDATAHDVILAVGGQTNGVNGPFSLDVSIVRDYVETSLAASCDDMAAATPIPGVTGDDAVSGAIDLPFPFALYGANQLEYAASTNGLLQLFPTVAGAMPDATYDNQPVPTAAAPNGFVAPLWDDLYVEAPTSQVVSRVVGTAPTRHFTVQWTAASYFADRTARLTFQVKLFEGTNIAEIHYCSLTPGTMAPLATGGSATVGIESGDGTRGHQHSYNTPGSVTSGSAIRFAP